MVYHLSFIPISFPLLPAFPESLLRSALFGLVIFFARFEVGANEESEEQDNQYHVPYVAYGGCE